MKKVLMCAMIMFSATVGATGYGSSNVPVVACYINGEFATYMQIVTCHIKGGKAAGEDGWRETKG